MRYHARDMAVVRAREQQNPDRARVGDAVGRDRSQRAARPLRASASAGAVRRPASAGGRGDRPAARRPAARALHRAAARRGGEDRAGARRAGAAVPQPPRLCAAHAVQRLRPSPGLPELRRLAGRSPLQAAAGLPPLRLLDAAAGEVPEMRRPSTASSPVGPGVERLEQEAAELFPDKRILVLSSDLVESMERLRQELDDVARGPLRHRDRHAARRQGPSFPQAQSGRHRRCRSRPGERRSARRRAHVPAAASGGRPRRPRGRAAATASCRRISPSIR